MNPPLPSNPAETVMKTAIAIDIDLNGTPRRVPSGTTLADLVREVLPDARAYAVEVNRSVVARREHGDRCVTSGDRIEIVTLVGGG